jgi:glucose dehydrogenase
MAEAGLHYCRTGLLWLALTAPLAAAPGDDWPLHGLNYANTRSSPLAEITAKNVSGLSLAWQVDTGKPGAFQATPIVVDGLMYVSTPGNDVLALDAATGAERWRYRHPLGSEALCCGPANRGVAVADGRVIQATVDNRLLALDAGTGAVLWNVAITNADPSVREVFAPLLGENAFTAATVTGGTGYTANMAPQAFDGMVYVGISGTGYGLHLDRAGGGDAALSVVGLSGGTHGLRGFLAAYDARTGTERWRWYSVPETGWEGEFRATTVDGDPLHREIDGERASADRWRDSWRLGGGSVWSTPAIDIRTRTLYFGTGNPAPQMDDATRPGDNLHTCSLVALDADTGKLRWAFQLVPHDRWGYDAASPPVLLEVKVAGKQHQAVAIAAKTGWVYVLDRHTGALLYRSEPFVPQQNLYARPTETGVTIAPAILGGASWSPAAWDASGARYFVEGIHHPATYFSKPLVPRPDQPWTSYTFMELAPTGRAGTLTAIATDSGKRLWQIDRPAPMLGGLLVTAGGLLFAGEGDGALRAWAADSGRELWHYQAKAGVNAPPISYRAGGRQYIAVAAGGNPLFNFPGGDHLLVFALPVEGSAP